MTQIALDLGAESRDLDALQYHPNGGAWPAEHAGLLDPGDDTGVRRDAPERRRARSSRIRSARATTVSQAIFDEVAAGRGVETPDGRPAVYLDTTRIPEADADVSLPYMLRRYRAAGIDPLQRRS